MARARRRCWQPQPGRALPLPGAAAAALQPCSGWRAEGRGRSGAGGGRSSAGGGRSGAGGGRSQPASGTAERRPLHKRSCSRLQGAALLAAAVVAVDTGWAVTVGELTSDILLKLGQGNAVVRSAGWLRPAGKRRGLHLPFPGRRQGHELAAPRRSPILQPRRTLRGRSASCRGTCVCGEGARRERGGFWGDRGLKGVVLIDLDRHREIQQRRSGEADTSPGLLCLARAGGGHKGVFTRLLPPPRVTPATSQRWRAARAQKSWAGAKPTLRRGAVGRCQGEVPGAEWH